MKTNNKLVNGFMMAIITLLATAITTTGLPKTTIEWEIMGITAGGTVLTYAAKNVIFPNYSLFGTLNLADIASGLFMALGAGLSSWAATAVTSVAINWHDLLTLCTSILITYLAKKVMSAQQSVKQDIQTSKAIRNSTFISVNSVNANAK